MLGDLLLMSTLLSWCQLQGHAIFRGYISRIKFSWMLKNWIIHGFIVPKTINTNLSFTSEYFLVVFQITKTTNFLPSKIPTL